MHNEALNNQSAKSIAVLFSSGIESAALLAEFLNRNYFVHPFYIKGNFSYEAREMVSAGKVWQHFAKQHTSFLKPIAFIDFSWGVEGFSRHGQFQEDIIIPLRNFLLTGIAAIHMHKRNLNQIALGTLGHSCFPDNHAQYFDELAKLISIGLRDHFEILTPFLGMKKEEVLKKYAKLIPCHLTYSCVNPPNNEKQCGLCAKCLERKTALQLSGVNDTTEYDHKNEIVD